MIQRSFRRRKYLCNFCNRTVIFGILVVFVLHRLSCVFILSGSIYDTNLDFLTAGDSCYGFVCAFDELNE